MPPKSTTYKPQVEQRNVKNFSAFLDLYRTSSQKSLVFFQTYGDTVPTQQPGETSLLMVPVTFYTYKFFDCSTGTLWVFQYRETNQSPAGQLPRTGPIHRAMLHVKGIPTCEDHIDSETLTELNEAIENAHLSELMKPHGAS